MAWKRLKEGVANNKRKTGKTMMSTLIVETRQATGPSGSQQMAVTLEGALDAQTTPHLAPVIFSVLAGRPKHLVFHLEKLTAVNNEGMRLIAGAAGLQKIYGGRVTCVISDQKKEWLSAAMDGPASFQSYLLAIGECCSEEFGAEAA